MYRNSSQRVDRPFASFVTKASVFQGSGSDLFEMLTLREIAPLFLWKGMGLTSGGALLQGAKLFTVIKT